MRSLSFDDDFQLVPDEIVERVLVIGGGIAGLQAALEVADMGYAVTLLEREPSLGGNMARLENLFPMLDHAVCELRSRMQAVAANPLIQVLTWSELEELSGLGGDFTAAIRCKARKVNDRCNGCGICWRQCPVEVSSEFDLGLGKRKAIYIPFPQAIPAIPIIDSQNCRHASDGCAICQQACPLHLIDFEQADEETRERFGAVIVTTGFVPFDPSLLSELGFSRYRDVISSLQLERLLSGAGPTKGEALRPSNGKPPRSVLFVSCVGSRNASIGRPYCSRICCSNIAKQAITLGKLYSNIRLQVLYTDIQMFGADSEELIHRAKEDYGAQYIRGEIVEISQGGEELVATARHLDTGETFHVAAEMIVLAVGFDPARGAETLAEKLGLIPDRIGFIAQVDPKLRPMETNVPGIYVAGAAAGPCDVAEAQIQGSAAAAKAVSFLRKLSRQHERAAS